MMWLLLKSKEKNIPLDDKIVNCANNSHGERSEHGAFCGHLYSVYPYYKQQTCVLCNLVSSSVRFMQVFVELF